MKNDKQKKFVNELLDSDELFLKQMKSGGMKKPKNDILEKDSSRILTNDGRELFNEQK